MVVHNMPYTVAPFVDRVSEISEISQRLNHANCRLLTLVGPGGIGKTRLAIRVAKIVPSTLMMVFTSSPLQPLDSAEFIVSAVADAVGFQFRPGEEPKQQLFHYLREKALLLVLDNFEHLLDGAELLTEILLSRRLPAQTPGDLARGVEPARGMALPGTGCTIPKRMMPSSQGHIAPSSFSSSAPVRCAETCHWRMNKLAVIRICQLVEGMPLALELAAGWTKRCRPTRSPPRFSAVSTSSPLRCAMYPSATRVSGGL